MFEPGDITLDSTVMGVLFVSMGVLFVSTDNVGISKKQKPQPFRGEAFYGLFQ